MALAQPVQKVRVFVVPKQAEAEVKLLKTIAVLYVMDEPAHLARQDRQRERIYRVYDYLVAGTTAIFMIKSSF